MFHFVDINPDEIAEYRDQIDNLIDKFVSGAVSRETKEFEKLKYLDLNTLKKFVEEYFKQAQFTGLLEGKDFKLKGDKPNIFLMKFLSNPKVITEINKNRPEGVFEYPSLAEIKEKIRRKKKRLPPHRVGLPQSPVPKIEQKGINFNKKC